MSSGLNLKCDLPYYLVRGIELSRTQIFPAALMMWGAARFLGRPVQGQSEGNQSGLGHCPLLQSSGLKAWGNYCGDPPLGVFSRKPHVVSSSFSSSAALWEEPSSPAVSPTVS